MRQKTPKMPAAPKAKIPKSNVLGPLGRTQMPQSSQRPNSVVGEFARESDSPLDAFVPPKLKK